MCCQNHANSNSLNVNIWPGNLKSGSVVAVISLHWNFHQPEELSSASCGIVSNLWVAEEFKQCYINGWPRFTLQKSQKKQQLCLKKMLLYLKLIYLQECGTCACSLFAHDFEVVEPVTSLPFFSSSRSENESDPAGTMWHGVPGVRLRENHQREHWQPWLWWLHQVRDTHADVQKHNSNIESVNISLIVKYILNHLTRCTSRKEANIEKWVMLLSFILEIYHYFYILLSLLWRWKCYNLLPVENTFIQAINQRHTLLRQFEIWSIYRGERWEKNGFLLKWENECDPH